MMTLTADSLLVQIIPPRHIERDPVLLEAAMQSLSLDEKHPIALEIAGTETSKQFLLRATTPQAMAHAQAQLYARYPQARIVEVAASGDPLRLEDDEAVSVTELLAGSPSYLPLRTLNGEEWGREGTDPLPGILFALDNLPPNVRVVTQIGMVPAPPNWSQPSQRRAVEHPLELERARERLYARMQEGVPSTGFLIGLGVLLAGIFVFQRTQNSVPAWVYAALQAVIHGRDPQLSPEHVALLAFWACLLLALCLVLLFLRAVIQRHHNQKKIYDQRLVTQKTMRMAYRVRIRLYVIDRRAGKSHQKLLLALIDAWRAGRSRLARLDPLIAAYRQFHLASGNYFVARRLWPWSARWLLTSPKGMLSPLQGWWQGIPRSKHYIGVDTLAILWHLPYGASLATTTFLEQRRARSFSLPPSFLPAMYQRFPVGYNEHAGNRQWFAYPHECLATHTLIGGKSGEGKSTCIEQIVGEIVESGSGLLLIDPHGDLSEHVLSQVPASRVEDVVCIDLADPLYSVGINPLDVTLGRGRDKAVADLLHTLSHIWASSWGPRMENAFEMALRTLYEANKALVATHTQQGPHQQYTLLDVLPLLTDESFLHALLSQINDPFLARWWFTYYEPLSLTQQRDIINPVVSKTTKFESEIARRIVGQGCSTINLSQLIREQKVIVVKLAKGETGSDVAPLLGATILGLAQIALEEQATLDEASRVQLPIIIDEFQTLKGTDYGALAELRKYGATFFLATQSFEYLRKFDPALLSTVLANVKNFIIYHMSTEDAKVIYQELGVEPEDIATLESHMCYIRLTYQNIRQPAFSLRFQRKLPLPVGAAQVQNIRLRCQQRYARPVAEVDEQLRTALARAIALQPQSSQQAQASPTESPHQNGTNGQEDLAVPTAKKKRKGEWVKGGKKQSQSQQKHITPSAFTGSQDASMTGGMATENKQIDESQDQSSMDHEEKEEEHESGF